MISMAQEVPDTATEEAVEAEIVVEASRGYSVYIAMPSYHIHDESYTVTVPYHMIFNYASMHARQSKGKVRYRT